ncbi:MAG: lasso peptide biosynthesis B2 protein [Gammaproteobacteria bacterium]|nr:lasso peptide biosynthesis B2 protein [Gammaproteobacteria bacterium]
MQLRRRYYTGCAAVEAFLSFFWFDIFLWFRGFQDTYEIASVQQTKVVPTRLSLWHTKRVAKGVRWAIKLYPRGDRCLLKSLVVYRMISKRGISGKMIIGFDKTNAGDRTRHFFHAWIETQWGPIVEYEDVRERCLVLTEGVELEIEVPIISGSEEEPSGIRNLVTKKRL